MEKCRDFLGPSVVSPIKSKQARRIKRDLSAGGAGVSPFCSSLARMNGSIDDLDHDDPSLVAGPDLIPAETTRTSGPGRTLLQSIGIGSCGLQAES